MEREAVKTGEIGASESLQDGRDSPWGKFLETPYNFSGPKTFCRCTIFSNSNTVFIDFESLIFIVIIS